ncbi:MAG: exosortase/archaeosortase family protein [Rhodocyclaceae bacterium]|nr:MAG: exosortase/archaeosortase family protein [Rhodocyclaceae bacterium]
MPRQGGAVLRARHDAPASSSVSPPERVSLPWRSAWRVATVFLITFLVLHLLWEQAKGSAVERLWINHATVGAVVHLINLVSPDTHAQAAGPRVRAPGGGINVLNGCEGTDLLFLLWAGLMAFPMAWRRRAPAIVFGLGLVFILNELRIFALFFALRSDKALFDLLHTTVIPLLLIVGIILYFHAWIDQEQRLAVNP